ncbi:MAG: cytochrome c oxidase subunit II [Nitrosomonadaceae bacterium]|nr:cytochrome c oxidase subunit II [Nitrosomonadaceae bacterium]MDW7653349.1 cytochrome c oxidase subunit II [Nitrosomonadaceae bacterium]MDW7663612.1 cytochrome c oxidase subunit II [Nitrosomonadaceae bacterium]MDW7665426.1 cytochrome c oxidase subunit II [Nitrosomonadaceae bacterium]
MGVKIAKIITGFFALTLYSGAATSSYQLNLLTPQSGIATQIYDLHTLLLWICLAIFIGVFGVMFYSVLKHRKSLGYKAANFHHSTTVEIIWTIIPFIILISMAYPATQTIISMKDTASPDITIKATGYQWQWGYDYLKGEGEGASFYSKLSTPQEQIRNKAPKGEHYLREVDNNMVVPVGKKIRVLLTANDVIHAWSVQELGVKQDAVPGFIRDAWFKADKPGIYRGSCSELCGKEHAFMPIVVEAMEPEKYTQWAANQKKKSEATVVDVNKIFTIDELKVEGEKVYAANCAACHQANGKGLPGAFPALDGSKVANGPKTKHVNIVVNGETGTAMAAFKHLSDVDIAAVVTYERNAWGNSTGDIVQPSEINEFRK